MRRFRPLPATVLGQPETNAGFRPASWSGSSHDLANAISNWTQPAVPLSAPGEYAVSRFLEVHLPTTSTPVTPRHKSCMKLKIHTPLASEWSHLRLLQAGSG